MGAFIFNKYPSSSKPKEIIEVDLYNIYYIFGIQERLESVNKSLKEKVKQNLEVKSLRDLTNSRLLSPLPNLWFYAQLTRDKKASDIHVKESSTFVRNLQQDNGLFNIDKSSVDNGKKTNISSKLLPTKISVEIFKQYREQIPKKDTLLETINNDLSSRIKEGQINGHVLLLLQTLNILEPNSELINKSREAITIDLLQYKIIENITEPAAALEILMISELLHGNVKFDVQMIKEIELALNKLQLENGAFPFPNSKGPDILSTFAAVEIMVELGIDINMKDEILKYTNEIADESFHKLRREF